ncbi:uncharacterized protein LOC106714753 [Papilio machaon]|uniref:uncharacterized protein LOC106714753 n=1 Tax=Papilio machaon TaxID=76193 RepID=UPI001E6646B6|nr:uncharacterized protein LOC106714753 [Papilio machaon]
MSTCVVEEGRDEGGGENVACDELIVEVLPERPRRDVLVSARGRRACSEQGPHPSSHLHMQHGTSHLWGANSGRRGWSRKRTSAPQMGNTQGSMPRVALVLRSRRSWPVAPQSYRRCNMKTEFEMKQDFVRAAIKISTSSDFYLVPI